MTLNISGIGEELQTLDLDTWITIANLICINTLDSVHQNGANFQVKFKSGAAPGNESELISAVNSISDVDAFVDKSTGMRYRDDLKTAKTAKVCGECF